MKYVIYFISLISFTNLVWCDSVCDEARLKLELKQDVRDNGVLDCLRYNAPPQNDQETDSEQNLRVSAQWNSECSFEAINDWLPLLKMNFGINSLYDANGVKVEEDFDDQADMCEIIRAAIKEGKLGSNKKLYEIDPHIFDLIDCPGQDGQTEVCAANGSSYYENQTWNIFLHGLAVAIDGNPKSTKK